MHIGPSTSAQLLGVGLVASDSGLCIIHVMPARPRFLRATRQ